MRYTSSYILTDARLRFHVGFKAGFALATARRQVPFAVSFAKVSRRAAHDFGVFHALAGRVFDLSEFSGRRRGREIGKVYHNFWTHHVIHLKVARTKKNPIK